MTDEMTDERTPNFEKQLVIFAPSADAIEGPERRLDASKTGSWVFFSNVTRIGYGYDVTVTGIDGSNWFWVRAADHNDNRLTWQWCSNNRQVTLKCDPDRVATIRVAWQDGHLGGWMDVAYTCPSWWA